MTPPIDKLAGEIYSLMNKPTVHADSVAVANFILARESQMLDKFVEEIKSHYRTWPVHYKSDLDLVLRAALSKFKGE